MPTTKTTLIWTRDAITRTYHSTLPDGRYVTVRATGQRNGRSFGGAWRASTGWGADAKDIASGGTLAACKASVERIAAEAGTR